MLVLLAGPTAWRPLPKLAAFGAETEEAAGGCGDGFGELEVVVVERESEGLPGLGRQLVDLLWQAQA